MSDWNSDPLAGGAYMYRNVSSQSNEVEILRQPIAERIFLAGEALDYRSGYVDTAWRDGERAAELIIDSMPV